MNTFAEAVNSLFGIALSEKQLAQFNIYEAELQQWNSRINLTAIRTKEDIRSKHFLDSLSCALAWQHRTLPKRLIDIGTGAGFPGLVLKIVLPDLRVTLVESIGKKVIFCTHMVQMLGMQHVEIIQDRAEHVGQNHNYREQYDCAVARAVAHLSVLSEYLLPLVKIGGIMVAQKGSSVGQEIADAQHAIRILGGEEIIQVPVRLPEEHIARSLIVVEKMRSTPRVYPRDVKVVSSQPL